MENENTKSVKCECCDRMVEVSKDFDENKQWVRCTPCSLAWLSDEDD